MAGFTEFVPDGGSPPAPVQPLPSVAPAQAAPPADTQSTAKAPAQITRADVVRIAKEEGLDPARALAHWQQETSGGKNVKDSVDGAKGHFQITPNTFKSVMPEGNIDNPSDNVRGGVRFLKQIADKFPNNPEAQAASYFTGPDRVQRYGGDISKMGHIRDGEGVTVPEYVKGIMGHYDKFKAQFPGGGQEPAAQPKKQDGSFSDFTPDAVASPAAKAADQPGIVSDTLNLAGQGSAQAIQGLAYVADKATGGWMDKFSEEHLGRSLTAIAGDVAERYSSQMSPEMQAAAKKEWITDDNGAGEAWADPRAYYNGIINSLPATVLTIGPAGSAARFAATTALKASIAKSVALKIPVEQAVAAAQAAAVRAATYSAIAAGGAGEGLIAGGMQGFQVEEAISKLKDDTLEQSPAYQAALAANGGDKKQARATVSNDAGTQTLWQVGLATAVLGAGFDGYVGARLGKLMAGNAQEMGLGKSILHSIGIEVPTELTQGFFEQYLGNIAEWQHANPGKDLWEGVLNNAVGSGVAALGTGTAFGAMSGHGNADAPTLPPSRKDVDQAAAMTDTKPTEAEKKNGKYDKGVVDFHGLQFAIENPKGSERSGTDKGGKKWSVKMAHDYGEFVGYEGSDGDFVDGSMGPHPETPTVYVIDQRKVDPRDPLGNEHDEYKIQAGFDSPAAARRGYLANYEKGWKGIKSISQYSIPEFKAKLATGEFNKNAKPKPAAAPIAEQPAATPAAASAPAQDITPPQADVPSATEAPPQEEKADEVSTPEIPSTPIEAAPAAPAVIQGGPAPETPAAGEPASVAPAVDPRAEHLESIAKIYDAIGDAKRAQAMRQRAGAAPTESEDLDALQTIAETEKRAWDKRKSKGKPTSTGAGDGGSKPQGEANGPRNEDTGAVPATDDQPSAPDQRDEAGVPPTDAPGATSTAEGDTGSAPVSVPADSAAPDNEGEVGKQPEPEAPKEPKKPREPKKPKELGDSEAKVKKVKDPVVVMIEEGDNTRLTAHIYGAAQLTPTFEDGATILEEGVIQMSVLASNLGAIESTMKKMGFKFTDRLQTDVQEDKAAQRIQLSAVYKPAKSDIQDTGIVGGKPAGGNVRELPETTSDVEKDIDNLISATKASEHFTIERPDATFGTMLFLEAVREKIQTFLQFAGPGFGGRQGNAGYGYSLKEALVRKGATPEGMALVRAQADRYIGVVAKLQELTLSAPNVLAAHDAIFSASSKMVEEYGEQRKRPTEWGSELVRVTSLSMGDLSYYKNLFEANENTIDQTNRVVKKEPDRPPYIDNITRVGREDFRKGQNVSETEFKDAFGFRDVEFGEWVNQDTRQSSVNLAFDSFMDMADELGIPAKAIGLGGRLALSFGSRGQKNTKAAAHFEFIGAGSEVINLTKTHGNGTVSHEWFHALEHHLMNHVADGRNYTAGLRAIVQSYWEIEKIESAAKNLLRGENVYGADRNTPPRDRALAFLKGGWDDSYGGILKDESTYLTDAIKMDGRNGDPYYKTPVELVARANEAFLFDRLKGGSPYLTGPMVREGAMTQANGYKGTAYPAGSERVRFAGDYSNFYSGIDFGADGTIKLKDDAKNPQEMRRDEGQAIADGLAARIDSIMEEMGLKQFPEVKNGSMAESMFYHLRNGWFPENAAALMSWVAQAHRTEVSDVKANLLLQKSGQEDFEAALGQFAAQRITDWHSAGQDQKSIYDGLIEMYRKQPKLNIRTSTSSSMQQFSTPLPISYIAGLLGRVDVTTKLYEPTAGNGLLAITATPKNVIANELEAHRAKNLKLLGFPRVTQVDAIKAAEEKVYKNGEADAVLANPPFGKLESQALLDGYAVHKIDHLVVGKSLPAMFDKGRAVLIIGAQKVAGEINSREIPFFNWLYGHYNVASHFEIDGDFYDRQGAAWPIRVITIAGRQKSAKVGPQSGTITRVGYKASAVQESYDELWKQFEQARAASDTILTGNVGAGPADQPRSGAGGAGKPAVSGGDAGKGDSTAGGSGRKQGAGPGPIVPGIGGDGIPRAPVSGGVGEPHPVEPGSKHAGDVGGPGGSVTGEPGVGEGSTGGEQGNGSSDVPVAGAGLEGVTPEDLDRIFLDEPVLVPEATTGAPELSDGDGKSPPRGPRGGGKPKDKSTGVSSAERALGLDLSADIADIRRIIGEEGSGGSMFSRKLYEEALGTVDATIYQQLAGSFERVWTAIRAKIQDATRALVEFRKIIAERFGKAVDKINGYMRAFMLDKMYPPQLPITEDIGKDNLHQVIYKGKSQGGNMGILVPRWLASSLERSLDALEERHQDTHASVDDYVRDELGYKTEQEMFNALSGYQIDNIALAIDQIKANKGIVIGDATGVGKGRQAAALIWWSIKNNKIPVFMSYKDDLYSDMYRDLIAIGHAEVKPLLTNTDGEILDPRDPKGKTKLFANKPSVIKEHVKQIIETGKLPTGRNALFTSYSQINVANDRRAALDKLLSSGNAVMIMDESHNASGDSGVGEFLVDLFSASEPPVVYLSATYAKRTDNMPIYMRTNLGTLASDPASLVELLSAGGPQMQAVIAQMMVEDGQMSRREKDMSMLSVNYETDEENAVRDTRLADEATEGLRAIVRADKAFYEWFKENMRTIVQLLPPGSQVKWGEGKKSHTTRQLAHGQFTSVVHNFVKQLLLSVKADNAVSEIVAALNRNEKPVVPLENTMEAALDYFLETNKVGIGESLYGYGWRSVLEKALDRRRTFTFKDAQGTKSERYEVPMSMLPPHVVRTFTEAAKVISKFDTPLSASPIDYMRSQLGKYGWHYTGKTDAAGHPERAYMLLSEAKGKRLTPVKVAEITGRKHIIDYSGEIPILGSRTKEQGASIQTVRDFNEGLLDAVFLNSSGSTGISLHASETFRDQRKRFMLVLQAAADISVLQQTLGRVHRTGQVVAPAYKMLATPLPAEKRPMAVTKKKMKSLLSNTSAGQESSTDIEAIDFINMYGDEAVTEYLRENPEVADFVDEDLPDQGALENIALMAGGRIALMSVADQKDFYEKVEHAYNAIITMKNESGTNKLIVRTLDTKAIPQQEVNLTDGGASDSVFGGPSYLVEYSIQIQGERPSADDVRKATAATLTGPDGSQRKPESIIGDIMAVREAPFEQAKAAELNKIEGAGGLNDQSKEPDLSPSKSKDIGTHIASIQKKLKGFDDVRTQTLQWLQKFKVGYGTILNMENGELPFGVVVGIKANLPSGGNPWSPSNFTINFMINNENRRASLPLSKIMRDNILNSSLREVSPESLDHHFKKSHSEGGARPRENRYFVVGNIPAGFDAVLLAGDVVIFSMEDGSVRTGLFLPRNFTPGKVVDQNLFLSNVNRYGDDYAKSIYEYLTSYNKQNHRNAADVVSIGVASKDNTIRLTGSPYGTDIRLTIQRSMGGKKIAEAKGLTAIVGDLAAAPKAPFQVTITDPEKAKQAIAFLAKRRGLYVLDSQVNATQPFMVKYLKGAPQAAFRRGAPAAGIKADAAQRAADELTAGWKDAPPYQAVQSITDLPAREQSQIQREGAQDAKGLIDPDGKVWLIGDNLADEADAKETFVHEVQGHYGLHRAFGKGLAAILDQIAVARAPQVKALLQAQKMENTAANRARAAEEILAVMAQKEPQLGFVRRAIAAIATWLREHGILSKTKLTDAEIIRNYILPAAKVVKEGVGAAVDDAQFSKSAVYSRTSELFANVIHSDAKVGMWSRTVGSMFNLAKKNLPFKHAFDAGQDFLADIWRHATASEKVAPSWFKKGWLQGINRKDADAVSQWLLHGTLIDTVFSDTDLAAGKMVKRPDGEVQMPGLTPDQIKMYHEAHAAIRVALETQAKTFIAKGATSMGVRINRELDLDDFSADIKQQLDQRIAEAKANIETLNDAKPDGYEDQVASLTAAVKGDMTSIAYINDLVGHVNKLSEEGYFPLSRYGTHFVAVYKTEEDYNKRDATYFALHEGLTQGAANTKSNADADRMHKQYPNAFKIETGIISKESFRLYDGLNLDALELFAKHMGLEKDEVFQEGYKKLFASRSMMKKLIHRKGTAGYSKDAYRALADFIMTTSRATSASENFPRMMQAIGDIKDGDVKDHAIGLYEYLKDPVEEAHKLRGYLFFHFIGGSLSSALVNLTQTGLVTAPFLTKHANPARVAAELIAAGKDAVKDPFAKRGDDYVNKGKLWDDLRKAEGDGTTAAQEIFQMMGVASGSKMAGNKYAESFLKAWGSMFGYAETFNRRTAYIAAHRIADANEKLGSAHEFAENAVHETQYLYNKGNRPRWARGALGSTVFTFKQFSVNTLELMARLPLQQKVYMLFLLMLMAGLEGLPFAEDIEDLIDTVGQRFPELGVTTNSKKWLDKTSKKVFGQFLGNAFVQGLPSAVSPYDVSQRMSMGNLLPGTAMAKVSETDKFRDIRDLLGPVAALVYGAAGGLEDILRGNFMGAAKKALPIAAQNVLKGGEMLAKGEARDGRGQFVAKVSPVEAAGKIVGLNPNSIADQQRTQRSIKADETYINVTRTALMDQYVNALINHQQDDINTINKKIAAWNQANPSMPIVMNPRSIRERMRVAEMDPAARQIKLAPKALRGEVADQLRGGK